MASQYFKIPIPKGYRIYFDEFSVAGTNFYKRAYFKAFKGKNVVLLLEPDPENKFDSNAIKVIAKKRFLLWDRFHHVGYLPAEIAQGIVEKELDGLIPRLKEAWISKKGNVGLVIDLLGPRSDYHKLDSAA